MDKEKEPSGLHPIGDIDFKDVKVIVYYDKYTKTEGCAWRMRNPDSCYQGLMYVNYETGETTYPEGAIVPKQTKKDREILPRFILTTEKEITDDFKVATLKYLNSEYKLRNGNG